jgi:hypothetical protein
VFQLSHSTQDIHSNHLPHASAALSASRIRIDELDFHAVSRFFSSWKAFSAGAAQSGRTIK